MSKGPSPLLECNNLLIRNFEPAYLSDLPRFFGPSFADPHAQVRLETRVTPGCGAQFFACKQRFADLPLHHMAFKLDRFAEKLVQDNNQELGINVDEEKQDD